MPLTLADGDRVLLRSIFVGSDNLNPVLIQYGTYAFTEGSHTLEVKLCSLGMQKKKKQPNVLWHSTGFQSCLSFFFGSSMCLLVRVTMMNKNKAVVCCSLATSAILLSEKKKRKRKMWSKKWYLKRNISCDAHLLNELLETDVP